MSDYIRLAEAPTWVIQYPQCSACVVDLEYEDGWTCPVCGTAWPGNASDGDEGTLYEEWSGAEVDDDEPRLSEDEARNAGIAYESALRKASYARWGWCEHGSTGQCWTKGCAGGSSAALTERSESDG